MEAICTVRCTLAFAGAWMLGTFPALAQSSRIPGPVRPPVRSENFIVFAATQALADEIARTAEQQRHELAVHWLGQPIPNWSQPCPINVLAGPQIGAGGSTTFELSQGRVGNWRMNVQGSRERILDSVLPHEITHTILASHFAPLGRPVPRWADEGACTTVEHVSEKSKHDHFLIEFLSQGRGIPFATMFSLREYPPDIMPLYAQGYSVSCFLIAQGGPRRFVQFLEDGMRTEDWVAATEKHYQYPKIGKLQTAWNRWVGDGGGSVAQHTADAMGMSQRALAANTTTPSNLNTASQDPIVFVGATRSLANEAAAAPGTAANPFTASPSTTAIAGDSWYKRQLKSHAETGQAAAEVAEASLPSAVPAPFNKEHSVAHPQAMQGFGNAPTGNWAAGPSVPIYR